MQMQCSALPCVFIQEQWGGILAQGHLRHGVLEESPRLLLEARGLLLHPSSGFAHEPITRRVLAIRVGQQLRGWHVHLQPVLQDLQQQPWAVKKGQLATLAVGPNAGIACTYRTQQLDADQCMGKMLNK